MEIPSVSIWIILAQLTEKAVAPPLQYSCLENPMDGGAWCTAVHGVTKSRTRLTNFTFTFHFHALEMEMATHSSVLAWRIPGTGEPGGLPSMGSHRVGHNWKHSSSSSTAEDFRVVGLILEIWIPLLNPMCLSLSSETHESRPGNTWSLSVCEGGAWKQSGTR